MLCLYRIGWLQRWKLVYFRFWFLLSKYVKIIRIRNEIIHVNRSRLYDILTWVTFFYCISTKIMLPMPKLTKNGFHVFFLYICQWKLRPFMPKRDANLVWQSHILSPIITYHRIFNKTNSTGSSIFVLRWTTKY